MSFTAYILLFSVIIFVCILLNKVSSRMGIPVLLLFIVLGMLSGLKVEPTVESCRLVENICTFSLIFIMFYGGFGTRWSSAKPVAVEAGLLATLGVFLTAATVGVFCHFALGWGWVESFLMGSVISSTDAATVFSILRTRKMGLKNNTAPLLEVESGSNDPCSNLMTIVMLSLLSGNVTGGGVVWTVVAQFLFGIIGGLAIAKGAAIVLKRVSFPSGMDSMFMLAVAILAYALPTIVGGNGYLSTYIVGIILGNTEFRGRKPMVNFFDGITSLTQIMIFYSLGLMSDYRSLAKVVVPALLIFAFITLVARPFAVSSILGMFKKDGKRKYPLKQLGLISFVGLRGAASIVFAIMTITKGASLDHDIFSIVFVIVLVSILLQGALIPKAASSLDMVDSSEDVMKTFSDYSEVAEVSFGRIEVDERSEWAGKKIFELHLPKEMLVTMIIRGDEKIVPKGSTELQRGDRLIFCSRSYINETEAKLHEHPLSKNSKWEGHAIKEYPAPDGSLVVMIKRGDDSIIPDGNTVLQKGDVLVILDQEA